jgi:hypothetical protein
MGAFTKGQRVRIVKVQQKIPQLNKYVGSQGSIGREPRPSHYYVRLHSLGIYEYFPENWLEPLDEPSGSKI